MVENARLYARTCGWIYVLIFIAGLFGEVFVSGRLVVEGDGAATAAKIVGSEQLWRDGFAAQVVTMLCDVAVAWLLYLLLAPVNRNLALLSAFFRLTYVAIYGAAAAAQFAALPLAQQHLQNAAMFSLRLHNLCFALSLVFFGANLVLVGYLIARIPLAVQWLGVALQIAGGCYILNSFALWVAPAVHSVLYPWILLPPFFGEVSLTFWLLLTRRFQAAAESFEIETAPV